MKKLISLALAVVLATCSVTVAFAGSTTTEYKLGDVDNDGIVCIIDATLIQQHLAGSVILDDNIRICADTNGDDMITIDDCTEIQRFVAKIINQLPGEEKFKDKLSQSSSDPYGIPNEFESEVFEIVNRYRAEEGIAPLKFGNFYYKCAKHRAEECNTLFSHSRPDGSMCETVFGEFGISIEGKVVGENIARYFDSPEEVMKAWMGSPGHRENILEKSYDYVAVGVYENPDHPGYYVVLQLFFSD